MRYYPGPGRGTKRRLLNEVGMRLIKGQWRVSGLSKNERRTSSPASSTTCSIGRSTVLPCVEIGLAPAKHQLELRIYATNAQRNRHSPFSMPDGTRGLYRHRQSIACHRDGAMRCDGSEFDHPQQVPRIELRHMCSHRLRRRCNTSSVLRIAQFKFIVPIYSAKNALASSLSDSFVPCGCSRLYVSTPPAGRDETDR